jgi:hypothetical protein
VAVGSVVVVAIASTIVVFVVESLLRPRAAEMFPSTPVPGVLVVVIPVAVIPVVATPVAPPSIGIAAPPSILLEGVHESDLLGGRRVGSVGRSTRCTMRVDSWSCALHRLSRRLGLREGEHKRRRIVRIDLVICAVDWGCRSGARQKPAPPLRKNDPPREADALLWIMLFAQASFSAAVAAASR